MTGIEYIGLFFEGLGIFEWYTFLLVSVLLLINGVIYCVFESNKVMSFIFLTTGLFFLVGTLNTLDEPYFTYFIQGLIVIGILFAVSLIYSTWGIKPEKCDYDDNENETDKEVFGWK